MAGRGSRIAPLPGSKELYPLGLRDTPLGPRPKVVSHGLLEQLRKAGIARAYLVLREGKWDIPAYFKDGAWLDLHLAYLVTTVPFGAPFTLDTAYPFVKGRRIALGFPDILLQPEDAFIRLLEAQSRTQAEVMLGVFPCPKPEQADMVEVGPLQQVRRIEIKPKETACTQTWMNAVWTPGFTEFMHDFLQSARGAFEDGTALRELYLGDVIQAALDAGLNVQALAFEAGRYIDIGTPEGLMRALQDHSAGLVNGAA